MAKHLFMLAALLAGLGIAGPAAAQDLSGTLRGGSPGSVSSSPGSTSRNPGLYSRGPASLNRDDPRDRSDLMIERMESEQRLDQIQIDRGRMDSDRARDAARSRSDELRLRGSNRPAVEPSVRESSATTSVSGSRVEANRDNAERQRREAERLRQREQELYFEEMRRLR